MEGPLLVIKAWGLTFVMIWVYRRYFEKVAARSPEFEARCEQRPRIFLLRTDPTRAQEVKAALETLLGRLQSTVATLGGFPWPHYALQLELEITSQGYVSGRILRADLRSTHEKTLPALVTTIRDLRNLFPSAIDDVWLAPDLIHEGLEKDPRILGFRVFAGDEARPRFEASRVRFEWLKT